MSAKEGEWMLFQMVAHLTMKECQCYVYSNLITLKRGQKILYNGTTSGFKLQS